MNAVKKWLLILLFCLAPVCINAQVPDSIFYGRLYYTCKVWGHVKYYHTETAKGNVDWDNVLLASVHAIKTAPDNMAFNDSLLVMLNKAGPMGSSSSALPGVPDSLNNNLDLGWIHDPVFTDPVETILEDIISKFRPQRNVYVGEAWAGGNPTFGNDRKYYLGNDYPDESIRVLALFRFWNIIHYFFPYKNIMDQDWNTTLTEFIPKIVSAPDELAYHLAFKEFTVKINDSHALLSSYIYSLWYGNYFPPFLARFIENEMVITKVLPSITEVKQGDIIKEIDGIDIYHLRDSLRKYAHGSNAVAIERNVNEIILWGEAGNFSISFSNGAHEKTATLNRNSTNYDNLYADNSPVWEIVTTDNGCFYGLVDVGRLETTEVKTMFTELWNTEAIIFDIRNYPRGTLWTMVDYLFESPIYIANFTTPDITFPGRLYWQDEHIGMGTQASPYRGKIILLFDERTISQAEYTCMGLEQFPETIKIGSTTAAADGNVAIIYLPGNIRAYATFLGTYYPDYQRTQRIGIIPDFEVMPTIQGIRNGRDEVMDFALNCRFTNITNTSPDDGILKLYPNPTKDYLYYEMEYGNPGLFEIYNAVGAKCLTIHTVEASGSIDLSGLESGVYHVKIVINNRVYSKKIIKN
jgi:hypothetical protein